MALEVTLWSATALAAAWASPAWCIAVLLQCAWLVGLGAPQHAPGISTSRARSVVAVLGGLNGFVAVSAAGALALGASDLFEAAEILSIGATFELAEAVLSRLARESVVPGFGLGLAGLGVAWGLSRGRVSLARWSLAVAATSVVVAGSVWMERASGVASASMLGSAARAAIERAPPVAPFRAPSVTTPRYPRVVLIMLESVGRESFAERIAADGELARLAADGLYLETALSPSNVSHFGQPAILLGRDLGRSRTTRAHVDPPIQPTLGMADWFHAVGYRTVMVSSQDERWLGLDRVIASQPWDILIHSQSAPNARGLYRDACGTEQVLDSVTTERFIEAMLASEGPAFGYLNLQNTHYPYLVEESADPLDFEGLDCWSFDVMPTDRLALARSRFERALRETEGRVQRVVAALPGALVILVGDHGEEFVAGWRFAHAKTVSLAQIATSAIFAGPGLSSRRIRSQVSTLDVYPTMLDLAFPGALAQLPPGMLEGRSVLAFDERAAQNHSYFAVAHGLSRSGIGILRGALRYRVEPDGTEICEGRSGASAGASECDALKDRLASWLECQMFFGSELNEHARTHYNPCFEHFRE